MSAFDDHTGKINSSHFNSLIFGRTGRESDRVRKGPRFGTDTAVIDLGDGKGLAVSSDPLSLIPSLGLEESAWLTVHLLANDMATTGFAPQYVQFVLNLPAELSREDFSAYWGHIHGLCDEIGVSITGGHTAQLPGQNTTTPGGGTMFLQAPLDEIITSDGAEPGDRIVVTKEAALTASSILALSFPETVRDGCGRDLHERACENFYRTSSLSDALAAAKALQPRTELRAMHDVTEGGILGGIWEMARASECGFRLHDDRIPVGEAPRRVCDLFDIDPRYCVGAGSMVMAVREDRAEQLVEQLGEASVPAAVVGTLTPAGEGCVLVGENGERPFEYDETDPYWNAFFKAMEAGWT